MNDTYITIQGWAGTDVVLTQLPSGDCVAQFRVATTPRRFRRETQTWVDGPTTWYTVKAWRKLAEHLAASVSSGEPVVVHGRLEADVWQKQDGSTQVTHQVIATSIGHDLSRGTTQFSRPEPVGESSTPVSEETEDLAARAVEDPSAWTVPNAPAA